MGLEDQHLLIGGVFILGIVVQLMVGARDWPVTIIVAVAVAAIAGKAVERGFPQSLIPGFLTDPKGLFWIVCYVVVGAVALFFIWCVVKHLWEVAERNMGTQPVAPRVVQQQVQVKRPPPQKFQFVQQSSQTQQPEFHLPEDNIPHGLRSAFYADGMNPWRLYHATDFETALKIFESQLLKPGEEESMWFHENFEYVLIYAGGDGLILVAEFAPRVESMTSHSDGRYSIKLVTEGKGGFFKPKRDSVKFIALLYPDGTVFQKRR